MSQISFWNIYFKSAVAALRRPYNNMTIHHKLFWKISQKSLRCSAFLAKLQLATFVKKNSIREVLLWVLRSFYKLFSRTLVNGCIALNKLANSLCSLIYASGNRPRFRKRFSEFKVNESPNRQCQVTSHYSTGKNLLKKKLTKNICKNL